MKQQVFSRLFSTGSIGTLTLKNRIVVTAMGVSFGEADGSWGERLCAYHEAQAKGGAGLIVSGATGVAWPVGGVQMNQIAISDDRFISGIEKTVAAVHRHGAKFAVQLHHAGPVGLIDLLEGRPLWVPSAQTPKESMYDKTILPEEFEGSLMSQIKSFEQKVLSHDDIKILVAQFAAAAGRAKKAGVDGVEIHGGHGYVLSSFLSPSTNQRTDEYGGPLENRARLLLEVIAAVRKEVGDDYPVWVKLDSRELLKDDGITIENAMATAKLVEAAGVDAITVTTYHNTGKGKVDGSSHSPMEPAKNLPFAAQIKDVLSIPVIASGRIEPQVADDAIAQNKADFISYGRKILADPDFPNKLKNNQLNTVRPCIYCYTCISSVVYGKTVRCAVNPDVGQEFLLQPLPTPTGKHIVVVGGGPGGMDVARRLDVLGYKVTLLEQSHQLGGTLRFASIAYAANEELMNWLIAALEESSVIIKLNTAATAVLLKQIAADAVVVASGAIRTLPDIPGNHLPHVLSGDNMRQLIMGGSNESLKAKTGLLTRIVTKVGAVSGVTSKPALVRQASKQWMPLGKKIAIIGGDLVGLELAEFLAERGRIVSVIDDKPAVGKGLPIVRRVGVLVDLDEQGVSIYRRAEALRIEPEAVHFSVEGKALSVVADHVIVAQGAMANLALAKQLTASGFTTLTVGDCNGVGYIDGAMSSAVKAVADIQSLLQA